MVPAARIENGRVSRRVAMDGRESSELLGVHNDRVMVEGREVGEIQRPLIWDEEGLAEQRRSHSQY